MSIYPNSPRLINQAYRVCDYGGSHVRCGGTADNPWFIAKDVCDVLGIADHKDAISGLDNDEKDEVGITARQTHFKHLENQGDWPSIQCSFPLACV